jgi:hypothetical protein
MTAKGLDRRAFFVGLALALTAAGTAEAQLVNGQWRVFTPQQGARSGVQVNTPTVFAQQTLVPRQPVAVAYIPTILMSDGTAYANYGYGYQQVVTCTPPVVAPYAMYGTAATVYGTGVSVYGSGTVYSTTTVASTGGIQTVPNQQTRSQQMVGVNMQYGGQVVASPCAQQATPAPTPAVGRRY